MSWNRVGSCRIDTHSALLPSDNKQPDSESGQIIDTLNGCGWNPVPRLMRKTGLGESIRVCRFITTDGAR